MKLKLGFAEANITPDKKVSLAGQFAERISQYVEKPLTATAFAIDDGKDHAVFVSCDLISINWGLMCGVRDALKDNDLGLDPQKIIISAIHTHTGYSYGGYSRAAVGASIKKTQEFMMEFALPGQKYVERENISDNPDIATPDENMALLVDKLPGIILEAWKNRKEGSYVNAFGRAVVGMCRRTAYSDGSAQMWGDTNTAVFTELEGSNDSGIELLYCFDDKKELTGIVANLACPAQCVQHRLFVSPDFWGEVKVRLRKHFGKEIFLLPLCSAAGDQCPVDLIRWVEPYSDINDPNCIRNNPPKRKADPSMFDLEGMYKAGKRIANEIIEIWNEGLDENIDEAPFEHRVIDMSLPIRRATLTDVANAKRGIREYLSQKGEELDYNDVANLQVHLGTLRRAKEQETRDVNLCEVHIIRLGSIAFATNPFELFLDYGNQIKARSDAEQTFLIQLANGTNGYLPTKKAEDNGHYSAFISSGNVGHEGGDLLVRQTLENIRDMFK